MIDSVSISLSYYYIQLGLDQLQKVERQYTCHRSRWLILITEA